MTLARLAVYDPTNTTYQGLLPPVTNTLSPSHEVGSAGSLKFTALASDLDAVDGWDSVVRLQIWDGTTYVTGPAYAVRPPHTRDKVAPADIDSPWQCDAVEVLEQWAGETLVLPEYVDQDMPPGAGTERGIGWMSSAYDPTTDPNEAWDGCYDTARTTMPTDWPSGTGAKWISITGASDSSERKLFRATLTVTVESLVKVWFHSDEEATLWLAGDPLITWSAGESQGKDPTATRFLVLQPGTYAVGVDTRSVWDSETGDGVDPVLVAIATIVDGDPDTWLLVSNEDDWVACRRDADPPGNEPPGPTPGAMIRYLVEEAQDRGVTGWAGVALGFDDLEDSYGQPWSTVVVERVCQVGSDTLWTVFQGLAEANEVDVWMDGENILYAAPQQGTTLTLTLGDDAVASSSETRGGAPGTWCAALGRDGWVNGETGSPHRREFFMELGTALSRAISDRVVLAALNEGGRRDFRAKLIPVAGKVPLIHYKAGDTVPFGFGDVDTTVIILSISASPGDGGLLWEAELVEAPA